ESYTLTVAGLPAEWVALPATVPVSAGAQVTVPLTVQVPEDTASGSLPFNVFAANSSGGEDQAGAELMVVDGLDVALEPDIQSAAVGTAVTYTLVLTNHLETAETYTLTAEGAALAN